MRRIDARESGTTIFEVTVSVAILAAVLAAVLASLVSAQRSQAFVSARASALDSLRLTMNVLTKELRQAVWVDPASTAGTITVNTYVTGQPAPVLVRYQASGGNLTRQQGTQTPRVLQDRLASLLLFTYTPSAAGAQLVNVDLRITPRQAPDTTVRLTSDIRLRNGRAP